MDVAEAVALYAAGWFPMDDDHAAELPWYAAEQRAIFPLDAEFRVGLRRRLRRDMRAAEDLRLAVDGDYPTVLDLCAVPPDDTEGVWITPRLKRLYRALHTARVAHSFELRTPEGELAAGILAIVLGRAVLLESMRKVRLARATRCSSRRSTTSPRAASRSATSSSRRRTRCASAQSSFPARSTSGGWPRRWGGEPVGVTHPVVRWKGADSPPPHTGDRGSGAGPRVALGRAVPVQWPVAGWSGARARDHRRPPAGGERRRRRGSGSAPPPARRPFPRSIRRRHQLGCAARW